MNEDQLITLLSSMDDDLCEKEINTLLQGVEINMDSIRERACRKLNNNVKRTKYKKKFIYTAAACIGLLSITTVYADDISRAVKSFFNITPVYSTIVKGKAYYLKEARILDEHIKIDSIMATDRNISIGITSDLKRDELGDVSISKDKLSIASQGYGEEADSHKFYFNFMNKNENNIKSFKDFKLSIANKTFDISLEEAKSFDSDSKIYTAGSNANNVEGVNIGAIVINKKEKLNVQLVTTFDDEDLELVKFGAPDNTKVIQKMQYKENGEMTGTNTVSDDTASLFVQDKANNKYKLNDLNDLRAFPITVFETDAPKDTSLTLTLPGIVVRNPKIISEFSLDIPQKEQMVLNKEINFNFQKAVIKSIKRLSPTSAQVEFDLNTGSNEKIDIRSFNTFCTDVKSTLTEFNRDKAVMTMEFNKNINKIDMKIAYPELIMKGDWTLEIK